MDVYLSPSPPGSSHFPLGDGRSPGPDVPSASKSGLAEWQMRLHCMREPAAAEGSDRPSCLRVTSPGPRDSFCDASPVYHRWPETKHIRVSRRRPLRGRHQNTVTGPGGCCKVDLQHINVFTFGVIGGKNPASRSINPPAVESSTKVTVIGLIWQEKNKSLCRTVGKLNFKT